MTNFWIRKSTDGPVQVLDKAHKQTYEMKEGTNLFEKSFWDEHLYFKHRGDNYYGGQYLDTDEKNWVVPDDDQVSRNYEKYIKKRTDTLLQMLVGGGILVPLAFYMYKNPSEAKEIKEGMEILLGEDAKVPSRKHATSSSSSESTDSASTVSKSEDSESEESN